MARIKFLTDSAADIPTGLREEYSIQVLPFPIAMGERELADGFDFTPEEFYDMRLGAAEHPSRSHHSRDSGEARLCTFNVFRCPYITVENDRMRTCLEKITETVEIKVSPILLARNTRMKCHMFQRHV